MIAQSIVSFSLLASLATAHFSIDYPELRGDSFAEGASQWIYPCANVNQTAETNRTLWPLTGGSLKLDLHHQWTYVFINLGLGTDYPIFNYSLTPQMLNETGNGTLCLPQLVLPANLNATDGQNASIQVITVGESGSALYNCADITFSSTAKTLGNDTCSNSSNVAVVAVKQATTTGGAVGSAGGSILTAGTVAGLGALAVAWLL